MSPVSKLTPLPFHDALRAALRELEPGLWAWFSSDRFGKTYADDVRLELLRSTYRLPREARAHPYALADEICEALGIDAPLTLYQAQEDGPMNAALVYVPGELHVVFRGPIQTKLNEAELRALLGHELAHHKLWTEAGGDYRIASALIEDMAASGAPSHVQSALRFRLWTEVYADRAGLLACDDLAAAVSSLVKVGTGLDRVDGNAYVEQAIEAIGGTGTKATKSEGTTHPETFLRAFALKSWHSGGDFAEVERLIEGPVEIDALDLVQQRALTRTTERLVHTILASDVMRTEATLAHARRFFPEITPARSGGERPDLAGATDSVAEYVAYVLLDFAMADHEIEDIALAHVAALAADLDVKAAFRKIVKKELKLSAAALAELEVRGIRLETAPPPAALEAAASEQTS